MNVIAGIPYFEAEFDKNGKPTGPSPVLPDKVTDLFVVSHGWNNDKDEAEALYEELFTNFMAVGDPADLAGRSLAIVGVIWPSKKFDELVAASGEDQAVGGGASLNTSAASDPVSLAAITAKLDAMERFFSIPRTCSACGGLGLCCQISRTRQRRAASLSRSCGGCSTHRPPTRRTRQRGSSRTTATTS